MGVPKVCDRRIICILENGSCPESRRGRSEGLKYCDICPEGSAGSGRAGFGSLIASDSYVDICSISMQADHDDIFSDLLTLLTNFCLLLCVPAKRPSLLTSKIANVLFFA